MSQKNTGLTAAILFASVVLSGSIVFFGLQLTSGNAEATPESIEQGIENYIKKQQESQQEAVQKEIDVKSAMAKNVKKVSSDDHIRGNKDAKISLIEYSDFECPFCKAFHPTANRIVDEYNGEVNWVYRHFPLDFHDPLAIQEAVAAECANELGGNDKFWEMTDLLFERTSSNGRGLDANNLPEFAAEIGLDRDSFAECLESRKYESHVAQDIEEGSAAGVTGTPGNIIINNETGETMLVEGAQPFDSFKPIIDQMLNQ